MKNVNVSAKWSFVLPTKDTTICNYMKAKRLKDITFDPNHEMYFYSGKNKVAITLENRKDYLNVAVCTRCKLFHEMYPDYNLNYDILYNDGEGCMMPLKNIAEALINLGKERIALQCLKSRDYKELLDLQVLIGVFISDSREKHMITASTDKYLKELENVPNWLIILSKHGISLKVS